MKRKRALLLTMTVVMILCVACGAWLHVQQQQYIRNRQLVAALTHGDAKRALSLVNEGADPNTRQYPPPEPTLADLLDRLIHRSTPLSGTHRTALQLAYNIDWDGLHYHPVPSGLVAENLPLLRAMLEHGANTRAVSGGKGTLLHYAAFTDRTHTAELLLQHGADVNAQDEWGQTPLLMAVKKGNVRVVRLLLEHGANPNLPDLGAMTPLHYTVMSPYFTRTIPELLAHGANPRLPNLGGITPLMVAEQINRPDVVALLKGGAWREVLPSTPRPSP